MNQAAAHLKTGEKETTTAIQISTLINPIRSLPRSQDTPSPSPARVRDKKDGCSCWIIAQWPDCVYPLQYNIIFKAHCHHRVSTLWVHYLALSGVESATKSWCLIVLPRPRSLNFSINHLIPKVFMTQGSINQIRFRTQILLCKPSAQNILGLYFPLILSKMFYVVRHKTIVGYIWTFLNFSSKFLHQISFCFRIRERGRSQILTGAKFSYTRNFLNRLVVSRLKRSNLKFSPADIFFISCMTLQSRREATNRLLLCFI